MESDKKRQGNSDTVILQRNLPVLVGSAFLLGGIYRITQPLQQLMVKELGGSVAIVGLIVSLSSFSMLITQYVFGEYSDTIGRRLPIILSGLFFLTSSLLFWSAAHWLVLLPAVLLMGFGYALNQPAAIAATAESVPYHQRGRAFARRNTGQFLAGVIASLFAIRLLQGRTLQSAFSLCTIFALVNIGLVYFWFKETHFPSHDSSMTKVLQNIRENWRIPPNLKRLHIYFTILDNFAFSTGWVIVFGLLAEFQGVAYEWILLYALIQSLTGSLFQLVGISGKLADWNRKWTIIIADSVGLSGIFMSALFPRESTYLVAFLSMGFAQGLFLPAFQAFVTDHVPKERIASEFGKLFGVRGIVSLFPPILGGLLAETYGYSAPLLVNVIMGIISTLYLIWKL